MSLPAPISDKLAKLIRLLLGSTNDGEIVAAKRAVTRMLESSGVDFHAVADAIAKPNDNSPKLAAVAIEKAYGEGFDDGFVEGRRFERREPREPDWYEIACACAACPDVLYEREHAFVDQMKRRTAAGIAPTEKQANWLRKIYARLR